MQPDQQPAPVRLFSFGGGVQSTAALVLAAQGKIDFRTFVFSNVGADSEDPLTLAYVDAVARPFAAEHGIELVTVQHGGTMPTVLLKVQRSAKVVPIPMRLGRTGAPGRRMCTHTYKIMPTLREAKRRGATVDRPAVIGLGITVDEVERMRSETDPRTPEQRRVYPLIDLRLDRQDCLNIVAGAGLPEPPKSACWFCPYHSLDAWRRMQNERPALFARAVALEALLQERREALGLAPVWMTDAGARQALRLDQVVGPAGQLTLDDAGCDGGYCMT